MPDILCGCGRFMHGQPPLDITPVTDATGASAVVFLPVDHFECPDCGNEIARLTASTIVCGRCRQADGPGVTALRFAGDFVKQHRVTVEDMDPPHTVWEADVWSCASCGNEIVTGFRAAQSRLAEVRVGRGRVAATRPPSPPH